MLTFEKQQIPWRCVYTAQHKETKERELLKRVLSLVKKDTDKISGSTFHRDGQMKTEYGQSHFNSW